MGTEAGSGRVDLELDVVLPGQLDARGVNAGLQPERVLMLAVLEEAISTYRKNACARTRRGRRLFAEAEAWCASDDLSWPFSFASICLELGLDAGWLRGGLRCWRDARRALPPHQYDVGRPVALRRRSSGTRTRATSLAGLQRRSA